VTDAYDSRPGTLEHIARVAELMDDFAALLRARAQRHDASKLSDPERSVFDEYTPKLKDSTYGSDEYKGYLAGMGEGLTSHYAHNRHHPEHFENGVDDMGLVDIIEMLMDWKAATERHDNGDLERSIRLNTDRFSLTPQLARILANTAAESGWSK